MDNRIKTMAAFLIAFAFAFCVLAPTEEVTADNDGLLVSPGPVGTDDGMKTLATEKSKSNPYGENYVHWFSLAIVALLVLLALAYLHVKAHKK